MRVDREALATDLYELLGVNPNATREQIQAAYRRQIRSSHPDLRPEDAEAGRKTARLNRAASVLLDPEARSLYDHRRVTSAFTRQSASWFERTSSDAAWSEPKRPPSKRRTSRYGRQLRGGTARLCYRLELRLGRLGREGQVTLLACCLTLGCLLVAWARPSTAQPQRVSVNPSALTP